MGRCAPYAAADPPIPPQNRESQGRAGSPLSPTKKEPISPYLTIASGESTLVNYYRARTPIEHSLPDPGVKTPTTSDSPRATCSPWTSDCPCTAPRRLHQRASLPPPSPILGLAPRVCYAQTHWSRADARIAQLCASTLDGIWVWRLSMESPAFACGYRDQRSAPLPQNAVAWLFLVNRRQQRVANGRVVRGLYLVDRLAPSGTY